MLINGVDKPMSMWGYLVAVTLVDGGRTTALDVSDRITDGIKHLDDIGIVDVESLGIVDWYAADGSEENQNGKS